MNATTSTKIVSEESVKGWTKKLTKKERKHLSSQGVRTTADLVKQLSYTIEEKKKGMEGIFCWDCYLIGQKLGVYGVVE